MGRPTIIGNRGIVAFGERASPAIGTLAVGQNNFNSALAEVRVYDPELSSSERQTLEQSFAIQYTISGS